MSRPGTRRSHDDAQPATQALGWLGGDQHGAQVLEMARRLLAAEQAAKDAMPAALALVCKVARIDRQQITLAVPSPAYAARLRQLAPSIVQTLMDGGWNLTEIKVKVQAGLLQSQTKRSSGKEVVPLDNAALAAFDELRGKLRPGPLADAVQRLLEHHRR